MRRVISILVQLAVAGVLLGTLVTAVLFAGRLTVLRWELDLPAYTHEIGEYRDTWMETRDGVRLSTQVILPEGEGPFPTIVLRSPYNVFRAVTIFCEVFARYGYACVHQDVRGRLTSEGEWSPLLNERNDGLDLLDWLREQPFQNGRWALWGMSYLAGVQWAIADRLPPEVKTMVSMVFSVESYDVAYEGGLFRPNVFAAWAALMPERGMAFWNGLRYARLIRHRPAREGDEAHLGLEIPWYRSWVEHERPSDPSWNTPDFLEFHASPTQVEVPVLMFAGYFDFFVHGQLRDFARLKTRPESKLVVGPWNHLQRSAADIPLPEDFDFGGQWGLFLDWLGHHLKDEPLDQSLGVISSYDVGAGGWRERAEFPPIPDRRQRFHLVELDRADCAGRGPRGEGELRVENPFPEDAAVDYVYDPDDPAPSLGGAAALSFAFRTFPDSVEPGARVQEPPCARDDILTFVSKPLPAATHMVGRPSAHLRVSSDAEDTAFGFELMVQTPDDPRWIHVREAYSRLSFRFGPDREAAYTPGEVVALDLEGWPIEWTLPAGARLRLDVRSASFPLYAAHPNRPGRWSAVSEAKTARQSLHPGSWLDLPVRSGDVSVLSGADLATVPPAMACKFEVDVSGTPEVIVDKAQKMIIDAGGSFSGDTAEGNYKVKLPVGSVEGKYTVSGSKIGFEITKKPMLVPCSAIESFLRDRLKSA